MEFSSEPWRIIFITSPKGNEILVLQSWKLINEMSAQTAVVYLFALYSLVNLMKWLTEATVGSICTVVQF